MKTRFTFVMMSVLLLLSLLPAAVLAQQDQPVAGSSAQLRAAVACKPKTYCVLMEYGTNARWWPDSWKKGKCANQKDTDWLVTYRTDNQTWKKADPNKIRIYSDNWWARLKINGKAQINDPYPPGITLCIGGSLSESEVKSVWVWLK